MPSDENTCQDLHSSAAVSERLNALFDARKLPHANLLVSENQDKVDDIVKLLANKILQCEFCDQHLDFFHVSLDDGSGTQITSEMIRDLIIKIQTSPKIAHYKVAYIAHAELMNKSAANSFLKTLEEPPADTFIFLSAENQYIILPTILSRCVVFKVSDKKEISSPVLKDIANSYESWLEMLYSCTKKNLAVMEMYKLLAYIEAHLGSLSESLSKKEIESSLLKTLEKSTAKVFKNHQDITLKIHNIIEIFEHSRFYLSINCNIVAYLEQCFILILCFFEKNKATENKDYGC